MSDEKQILRLDGLREEVLHLRVIAARLEPLAEQWSDVGVAEHNYLHAYAQEDVRAERAALGEFWAALGDDGLQCVQDSLRLANGLEELIARARGAIRGDTARLGEMVAASR